VPRPTTLTCTIIHLQTGFQISIRAIKGDTLGDFDDLTRNRMQTPKIKGDTLGDFDDLTRNRMLTPKIKGDTLGDFDDLTQQDANTQD
jgi:hypothetical protein